MTFSIAPFETSNVLLLVGMLFVAGIVEEVLDTWVLFTVVKRQTITTALITFFGVVLDFTVFLSFISNLDKWPVIIAYAVGATVGTVGVIEAQKYATRKKKEVQKVLRTKAARRKRIAEYAKARKEREKKEKLVKVEKVVVKPVKVVEKSSTDPKKGDTQNEVK